ncbi:DUF3050 domain-containing protein [Winogradskyella litorisediminis]|uniref:DUF3050 domain-containing protein n=1 Tax=Winogradskyella litorisediminis TaxID=1156618 RepID=A0ABW3N5P1_9FLAO
MTPNHINSKIEGLKQELLQHSLYKNIKTVEDLNIFLQYHVFAVWDFMSLLKALQNKLTGTTLPWIPVGLPSTRYLINEIVLAEETDINIDGQRQSHFEMYLEAMEDLKANTYFILDIIKNVNEGKDLFSVISNAKLPTEIKDFLKHTFTIAVKGEPHEIAAAFTFGREDLIPNMFTEILKEFQVNFPEKDLKKLVYYFERHIELDADEHGPMAMAMITDLCKNDSKKWQDVELTSITALEKRIQLWDCIEQEILKNKQSVIKEYGNI